MFLRCDLHVSEISSILPWCHMLLLIDLLSPPFLRFLDGTNLKMYLTPVLFSHLDLPQPWVHIRHSAPKPGTFPLPLYNCITAKARRSMLGQRPVEGLGTSHWALHISISSYCTLGPMMMYLTKSIQRVYYHMLLELKIPTHLFP